MGFVATAEEVETFQRISNRPGFSQEVLAVDFTTTPEFIKSVLPPGFDPPDKPCGNISISTWESKCCGEFDCTMVAVNCKWKGREGKYILTLLISNDLPVTWGREVWGEVKKTGDSRLFRSGKRRYGYGERRGVRLVELDAELEPDLPANDEESYSFEVKAFPHSTGIGLHDDARVVMIKIVDHNESRAVGKGKLTLRGSRADPLHTIPILSIGDFFYISGPTDYTVVEETPLGIGNAYLPYLVGRHYDDILDYHIGSSFEPEGKQTENQMEIKSRTLYSS